LHYLIHLQHGCVDLFDPGGLFLGCRGNLADDVCDALHGGHNLLKGIAGTCHQLRAVLYLANRILNKRLDLFGGRGAALREVADLGGNNSEPAALLSGAGRLHCGV
jgi:hypothetical protein